MARHRWRLRIITHVHRETKRGRERGRERGRVRQREGRAEPRPAEASRAEPGNGRMAAPPPTMAATEIGQSGATLWETFPAFSVSKHFSFALFLLHTHTLTHTHTHARARLLCRNMISFLFEKK